MTAFGLEVHAYSKQKDSTLAKEQELLKHIRINPSGGFTP